MDQDPDPYAVLGVTPTASPAEITQAFRLRLRALHPDSRSTSAQTAEADDVQLRHVLNAYVALRRRHHRSEAAEGRENPTFRTESVLPPTFTAGPVRRHD